MTKKIIYCCGCKKDVPAQLTTGVDIYPNRKDLAYLPFWKCDTCGNYVGCHYKTKDRTRPLGCIPTREIMEARKHIHALIDPAWKSGKITRSDLYKKIGHILGYEYHTAEIKTLTEARNVYRISKKIIEDICR